jgi:hypothetical protein
MEDDLTFPQIINGLSAPIATMTADGRVDLNRQFLDNLGMSRGTTYGPRYDPNALSEADDRVPRGAIFLFLSAKAMATFEFPQRAILG